MVHELTDPTFNDFVQKETFTVVDFYATWCPPCDRLSPVMSEIAEEYEDQITVGKLNVDENPETVQKYGVMSMPTVLVFQGGKVMSNLVGYRPKQQILEWLGLSAM